MNDALRPTNLAEFSGQPTATKHLSIVLGAANAREELCDHILLVGPPGTGKTTLAGIVAAELGVNLISTSGPAIEKPAEMASLLSSIREPSVLFIDEIHRLDIASEEMLYPAMEDGVIDIVVGEGPKTRSLRIPIEPLCVVEATQAGMLSGRFVLVSDSKPVQPLHRRGPHCCASQRALSWTTTQVLERSHVAAGERLLLTLFGGEVTSNR